MKQEKFMLPTMIESDFSAEELAEDTDGLQISFAACQDSRRRA